MWEMKILGVDLYHVLAWFWLYSFCGWIWESSYVSIRQKKLVNRGFVNGPLLTLYGTGAVLYSAADCRESSESCFGYYRRDHCFRCYRLLFGRFWIFRSRSIPAGTEDAQSGENVGRISEISAEVPL